MSKVLKPKVQAALEAIMAQRIDTDEKYLKKYRKAEALKKQRSELDSQIMKVINKDETHNHTAHGKMVCASRKNVYPLEAEGGRVKLDGWILKPLVEAGIDQSVIMDVQERLGIFKNSATESFVDQFRLDNGGKRVAISKAATMVVGGDLPDGIDLIVRDSISFRKA